MTLTGKKNLLIKFRPKYVGVIALLALLALPIFGHLNTLPLRLWDEARLAMNAANMADNGNLIVTYCDGNPDMWNTKPPLLIWIQALLIKTIGLNEIAIRLPSALAAFFTCMALLWLSIKYLKSFWFGFIAILVLITAQGYVSLHGTRTGDYDAMLTLFTTLYALVFFIFLETNKQKYLYLTFAFITAAVLTKSVAGLLFLPGLFLYTLFSKKLLVLLKNKHSYFGLLAMVSIVAGYYLLRENQNPGYIDAVFENELGGRYLKPIEDHYGKLWFYYNKISDYRFSFWYLLLPCGLLIGIFQKDTAVKKLTLYSSLLVLVFYTVITTAETKLEWYDMPLYPFLAIIAAVSIHFFFKILVAWKAPQETLAVNILPTIFLFLVFIKPYQATLDNTYWPTEQNWEKGFDIGYVMKKAINGKIDLNNYIILNNGSNTHWEFYAKMLKEKGQTVSFGHKENLHDGDKVLLFEDDNRDYIEDNYMEERLGEERSVIFYVIHEEQ